MTRLTLLALAAAAAALAAEEPPGLALFTKNCATCHDHAEPGTRIPPTAALKKLPLTAIRQALDTGVMRAQGATLSADERQSIATYLGVAPVTSTTLNQQPCPAPKGAANWTGWSAGDANWRFQTTEAAGLTATDIPHLKLRWAFALPGSTNVRSQPTVYRGRVYIGAQDGSVFSLNAATGCAYWTAKISGTVRTGISLGLVNGKLIAAAGDVTGSVYALDAETGKLLWKRHLDDHPATLVTATPVFHEGRLYVSTSSYEEVLPNNPDYVCCTFRGSIQALNATDGQVLWKTWTIPDPATPRPNNRNGKKVMGPSGVGVWAAATVDAARKLLYVPTGDNYSDPATETSDAILALSLDNGHIVWQRQFTAHDAFNVPCTKKEPNCPDSDGPDHDLGASPILVGHTLLLAQKSGVMHAIDVDRKGAILWETRVGQGGPLGGIQWGPATDGKLVYVALSDFGRPKPGGLFALRVDTGAIVWQTPNAAPQSAAVTAIPGVVFSGSLDAHLRAYDAEAGKIIWDYDAAREIPTVNGVQGKGGAFDTAGPAIADGMVFAGSGYAQWGGPGGNVLLAFTAETPAPHD